MIAATDMHPQTSTALPTVEEPDVLDLPGLFLVTGPEEDGQVGADLGFGAVFTRMTPAQARQVARAFTRAAAAAELVSA